MWVSFLASVAGGVPGQRNALSPRGVKLGTAAHEGCGGAGMRCKSILPDQLLGLWVLMVVGASPNMGAPRAQEGKYPSWGPGDHSYTWGFWR